MSTPSANRHDQKAVKHLDKARLIEDTDNWLRTDPAIQEWLKQCYDDGSLFISSYTRERTAWLDLGASWLKMERHAEVRLLDEAYERLWQIQQKKLFNLHCQWRAGQIDVPGIAVEADFDDWNYDIKECQLIPPVSDDELDLYLAYLASDHCTDVGIGRGDFSGHNWQKYDGFRRWLRAEETGEDDEFGGFFGVISGMVCPYPAWYAYYDQYRGTGFCVSMPDVRGPGPYRLPKPIREKHPEMAAIAAAQEAAEAAAPALPADAAPLSAPPVPPAAPKLPHLDPHDLALTETLFKRFESQELLHFMRACQYQTTETDHLTELANDASEELKHIRTPVPIRASPDWRQSLYVAYIDQRKAALVALLPGIYADYCQREEAGQPHPVQLFHPHRKSSDFTE